MAIEKKKWLVISLIVTVIVVGLGSTIVATIVIPLARTDDDDQDDTDIEVYDIEIVTRNATMISTMFATLNGELMDMGKSSSVEVYFVWGEERGEYPHKTPKQTLTSPGEFSAEITDLLMPDSTYYFQARSDPEGRGEEKSFYVF